MIPAPTIRKDPLHTSLRWISFVCILLLAQVVDAAAASVYVRWEANRVEDPLLTDFFDAPHAASADLTTGNFAVFTTAAGVSNSFSTGSGISQQLTFTNGNTFPFTIFAGMLTAHVEGAYAVVPAGLGLQTGVDGGAALVVATSGVSGATQRAQFAHVLRKNGFPASDVNQLTPTTQGGGSVVVTESSFDYLIADLTMPTFTLLPGESFSLSFQVDASVQRNSVADFYSTGGAQLSFKLPAGITLATNSSGPLGWVRVPEPGVAPMLAAGASALVALRPRRRQGVLVDPRG